MYPMNKLSGTKCCNFRPQKMVVLSVHLELNGDQQKIKRPVGWCLKYKVAMNVSYFQIPATFRLWKMKMLKNIKSEVLSDYIFGRFLKHLFKSLVTRQSYLSGFPKT